MLNKKLASEDVNVFVLADDPSNASASTVSGLQKTIFERFSKMNYNTYWITADEVLQVNFRNPASYYVLSNFDGLAFEHLKNLKCRVYSSFLIHRSLQEKRIIPKWGYPLFSSSLESHVICFSGVELMIKKQKSQLVHYMMGMVVGPLIDCVTHLVVKDLCVSSPKIECARRSGIRIVTVDAIDEAWRSALSNKSSEEGLRVQDVEITSVVSPTECFSNTRFYLLKSNNDARIEAEQVIKSNGGLVAHTLDETVDFVLASVIVTEDVLYQDKFPSKKLRTFYWMHKCVEGHTILYGANELFVPILFREANRAIFENCVVALSGLNALDRGVYEMLLLSHGAKVQNALCKNKTLRSGVTYEKNTHFIAGAESSRIKAVRAWKIHVLCAAWILQSILDGERLSEPMYDFDNASNIVISRADAIWNDVFGFFPASLDVVTISPIAAKTGERQRNTAKSSKVNASTCRPLTGSSHVFLSGDDGATNLANENCDTSLAHVDRMEGEVSREVENTIVLSKQQSHYDVSVRNSAEPSSHLSRMSCAESVYLDGERPFNIRFTEEDEERLNSINQEKPSQHEISDSLNAPGLFQSYVITQDEDGWLDKRAAQTSSMMSTANDENRRPQPRAAKKKGSEDFNSLSKRIAVSYDRNGSSQRGSSSDLGMKSPPKKGGK